MFLNFLTKTTRASLREATGLKLPEPVVTGMTHQSFIQSMASKRKR